ncbi:MAG: hypothetical protein ACR2QI_02330 [Woeseiaceae bacterium]
MNTREQDNSLAHTLISRALLLAVGATVTLNPGSATADETTPETEPVTHMSEAIRSSVKKVVVLPTTSPVDQAVTGSYGKQTKGLIDGGIAGSEIGKGPGTEVGGVSMRIPIPILTLPGALIGGISGATKREIQEFRDRLADDLAEGADLPVANDALASDVFWGLRRLPNLDSKVFALTTPIPEDTDAILYVSLKGVTINVEGKEAIITTSANATLRRLSDGEYLYEDDVEYQDRDTLSNWTENENALWRDYANFARHYIGREISAEVFDRVELRHELLPRKTDTVSRVKKNDWQGVSRSLTPTLAWELTMLGGNSYGVWANTIDEANISYDVEIYDTHRLVYSAKHVREPRHTIAEELEACKTYRWSVRPAYHVGNDIKFGEWMRFSSDTHTGKANVGRKASEAPAYIQDFASLNIKCGRR